MIKCLPELGWQVYQEKRILSLIEYVTQMVLAAAVANMNINVLMY